MKLWYVELEPLAARYTEQLGQEWAPEAFADASLVVGQGRMVRVPAPRVPSEIATGRVLDATGRGLVALSQSAEMLKLPIRTGDAVYLQDFWTPGIEALLYSWQQSGEAPRLYARNFAQSVDEYDFTWPMRKWMRPMEVGLSHALSGMFVASTIHRDQLRAAGYDCPIHVTGLPFRSRGPRSFTRGKNVAFTSRLDDEKNPWFMLEVANAFLAEHPDWTWTVSTSAARFKESRVLAGLRGVAERHERRLKVLPGLTKAQYLDLLQRSSIVFNSSLQDYVAFTMLEGADAGCDLCYPNIRSFPECVDPSRLYEPFVASDALRVLESAVRDPRVWPRAPGVCTVGFKVEMAIMLKEYDGPEVNVWHEPASSFRARGLL